eukprot:TRINITY_DN7007_c0_g1_i1.p1 TRINITY_DN7007_c0_g1~~TRINITY_DN7007_c0_g1_i1.p1  ORF type:complete len:397 (-),score=40.36 TRINITY_DN7007_c0_g1_i1:36-1226(-)
MSHILAFALIVQAASVTTLKLAQDVDYPPYAYKNEATGALMGIGHDIAVGMSALCDDVEIEVVQTKWSDCLTEQGLGVLLENGTVDACLTYTHTYGLRPKVADFSDGILRVSKPAGLLTLLDENGNPKVTGFDDLSGKTVVDVGGWAPTLQGLGFVRNKCTGKSYATDRKVLIAEGADNNNDLALSMLLNGTADVMYAYGDQAYNYKEGCAKTTQTKVNCSIWAGLGTKFAYVQTGQFGYVINGTTLAMAKKGLGIAAKLNPCLRKFMETRDYYDICVKYKLVDTCLPNSFFPRGEKVIPVYNMPTNELTGDCTTGYCPCVISTSNSSNNMKMSPIGLVALGIALLSILDKSGPRSQRRGELRPDGLSFRSDGVHLDITMRARTPSIINVDIAVCV